MAWTRAGGSPSFLGLSLSGTCALDLALLETLHRHPLIGQQAAHSFLLVLGEGGGVGGGEGLTI